MSPNSLPILKLSPPVVSFTRANIRSMGLMPLAVASSSSRCTSTPNFLKFLTVSGAVILARKFFILLAASAGSPAPRLAICNAAPNVATASSPCMPSFLASAVKVGKYLAMLLSSNAPALPPTTSISSALPIFSGAMPKLALRLNEVLAISPIAASAAVAVLATLSNMPIALS